MMKIKYVLVVICCSQIALPKMAPPSVSECGAKNQDKTFHLTPINVGNLVSPLLLNLPSYITYRYSIKYKEFKLNIYSQFIINSMKNNGIF